MQCQSSSRVQHDDSYSATLETRLHAGAYDTLERLSSCCDLVVVTSRQHVIQDVTLQWLDRHYGGLFQEVYFGNHFAMTGTSRKKSDICKWVPLVVCGCC